MLRRIDKRKKGKGRAERKNILFVGHQNQEEYREGRGKIAQMVDAAKMKGTHQH